jgi:N-methylhydantoinase B
MRALAPICPDKVSAGVGNMKVLAYSGVVDGQHWVYMDITEGSYGGRLGMDGIDAVDVLYANTRNNPIEDIEAHFPLRVTRYELRTDKSGPGKWRGGMGSIRDIEFTAPAHMSLEGDGHRHAPRGAFGGRDGTPGAVTYREAGSHQETSLASKFQSRWSRTGDVIRTISPCGGGFGPPLERDPRSVLDDVLDEHISLVSALDLYGVVIDGESLTLNVDATAKLRSQMTS